MSVRGRELPTFDELIDAMSVGWIVTEDAASALGAALDDPYVRVVGVRLGLLERDALDGVDDLWSRIALADHSREPLDVAETDAVWRALDVWRPFVLRQLLSWWRRNPTIEYELRHFLDFWDPAGEVWLRVRPRAFDLFRLRGPAEQRMIRRLAAELERTPGQVSM